MAEVMICAQSAQVEIHDETGETPDRLEWVRAERTIAHADHPVVVNYPHLWRPLPINYPTPAGAAEALGDIPSGATEHEGDIDDFVDRVVAKVHDAEPGESTKPAAKDVRAWAKDNKIDVPARGPIPDDVVEQYLEAQDG